MKQILKIGTRKSPLALKQVELTIAALKQKVAGFDDEYEVDIVPIISSGDKFLDAKLTEIGGKGLFTKEIDEALLAGEVDITVHSCKDMPTNLPEGISWPCVLPREDARDYYVSTKYPKLADLPENASFGSASLRRGIFMHALKSSLELKPLRGNIQTRLKKVKEGMVDATILACAGLERMGLKPSGHPLELEQFIPAPGQGIIAIQCGENDDKTKQLLEQINCMRTMRAALIEREVMRLLDGSCRTPIAAYAEINSSDYSLHAMLGNEHTGHMVKEKVSGKIADYKTICSELAKKLKASL